MRLTQEQADAIRQEVHRADAHAEVYLFGSRVDNAARGGDIDLLVVSDRVDFRGLLGLRRRILDRIGWQQLDGVVRRLRSDRRPTPGARQGGRHQTVNAARRLLEQGLAEPAEARRPEGHAFLPDRWLGPRRPDRP